MNFKLLLSLLAYISFIIFSGCNTSDHEAKDLSNKPFGLTEYYVDPDYSGGDSDGTAAKPWTSCDSSTQWDVIDKALASDAVTVYFSAREASSDTNEQTNDELKILRSDSSTNLLTLDGNSKYNTNDSNPSWTSYSGSSRFEIISDSSTPCITTTLDPTMKSYITLTGFRATVGSNIQAGIYWGGDHVTITDNIFDHSGVTSTHAGPCFQLIYARKVGDTEDPCVPDATHNCGCEYVEISDNIFIGGYGEILYIGGINERRASCDSSTALHRINEPGHDHITITGNTLYYSDTPAGGENDAIDIKPGNTNVTISGNTIYAANAGEGKDGIITDSGAEITGNYI